MLTITIVILLACLVLANPAARDVLQLAGVLAILAAGILLVVVTAVLMLGAVMGM